VGSSYKTASLNGFTLESHPPMSLFYTGGWLNELPIKKTINDTSFSQNRTTKLSSIGGELGGPKVANYTLLQQTCHNDFVTPITVKFRPQ
jgi:hypothetical protein